MDIRLSFPGGKQVAAHFGGFRVDTDQPPELGGEAAAPAPYDLFLASLATCAGIYALGFCQARSIPTEGLSVVQRHELDPETKLVSAVQISLQLPAGFPDKYRSAILRAVSHCKVKQTLAAPPRFDVAIAEAEDPQLEAAS